MSYEPSQIRMAQAVERHPTTASVADDWSCVSSFLSSQHLACQNPRMTRRSYRYLSRFHWYADVEYHPPIIGKKLPINARQTSATADFRAAMPAAHRFETLSYSA